MPDDTLVPSEPVSQETRATLNRVAREAGVAIGTVSGILNQRPDCYASQATRQRVIAAAEKLGYRPSLIARAMHGKATKTLGLILPAIDTSEIVARTFGSFELRAREDGYMTVAACTQNEPAIEDRIINDMLDRHVDAIAAYPTEMGPHSQLRRLVARNFPVISFDGAGRLDFPVDDVSIDQFQGGCLQARHLLELGRSRICVVNSRERCYVNDQKIAGLEHTLREAGCRSVQRMDLSLPGQSQREWRTEELEQIRGFLLAHAGEIDALAAVGDILALASIRIAIELGMRVPENLAVIGYNDLAVSAQVMPSLTTIHDPSERMGRQAYEILQERLARKRGANDVRQVKIAPELRVRESTVGVVK